MVFDAQSETLNLLLSIAGEEKQLNPFMRVNQPSLRALSGKDSDVETMTFVRTMKDNFKAPKQ